MAKCEFCDKGVTFGIKDVEAQCEACEGNCRRLSPPCVCLYPVYAFR